MRYTQTQGRIKGNVLVKQSDMHTKGNTTLADHQKGHTSLEQDTPVGEKELGKDSVV